MIKGITHQKMQDIEESEYRALQDRDRAKKKIIYADELVERGDLVIEVSPGHVRKASINHAKNSN